MAAAEAALEEFEDESSEHRDDELVVAVLSAHAPALLRTARRYAHDADDAQDAYQRALEIFVKRAGRLRRETAVNWLHQVIRNEALAVRTSRGKLVAVEELPDEGSGPSPEERVLSLDRTARAAEALSRLKPQEVSALWLKAQGLSYAEIAERQQWTYTKTNRCLTEGRRAFLDRFAGIESGAECRRWSEALNAFVDGEASAREVADLRTHLRHCPACRATVRELRGAGPSLAGVLPVAFVGAGAAPGRLDGLLARIYDAISGAFHERVAASAVKVQAAAEAASTGKVAAVAASAAALAGGGAITAHETGALHHRVHAAKPAHARRAAAPVSPSAAFRPPVRPRVVTAPATRSATTAHRRAKPAAVRPPSARRKATEREFGFESSPRVATRAAAPAATAAAKPRAAAAGASKATAEFGFERG